MGGLTSSVETIPTFQYKVGEVQLLAGLDFAGVLNRGYLMPLLLLMVLKWMRNKYPVVLLLSVERTTSGQANFIFSDQLSDGPRQQGGSEADHIVLLK